MLLGVYCEAISNFLGSKIYNPSYLIYFYFLLFCILLSCFLLGVTFLLAYRQKYKEHEKITTYECGFEPYLFTRGNFYLQFYIIALLFILFDIETLFLLPWCFLGSLLTYESFYFLIIFFLILTIGFIIEWKQGALLWV